MEETSSDSSAGAFLGFLICVIGREMGGGGTPEALLCWKSGWKML